MARAALALVLLPLIGCDGTPPPPPPRRDAGPSLDAALPPTDGCLPCEPGPGCRYEGGDECNCGALVCDDGAIPREDGGVVDGGHDAGAPMLDATIPLDGCPTPLCPSPPTGCRYVGDDPCACGTLLCDCGGATCGAGEYCRYDSGCSGAGACMARPSLASCDAMPIATVCGCNAMTFSTACHAHAAGTSVASSGECTPPMDCRTGGCLIGQRCLECRSDGAPVYVCLPDGVSC
ncbi:MAG: hypothetical protein KF729_14290 [Sandaracinaceae bacterium]|nr:hypothetical protein [Sandaracinaceae bacterium]